MPKNKGGREVRKPKQAKTAKAGVAAGPVIQDLARSTKKSK